MRVTGNAFSDSLVNQLNLLASRQYNLQNQVATGQRIQAPEDDPVAMQRVMDLRAQNNNVGQYSRNIAMLKDRANIAFDAVKSVKTILDRAGEIATLADGTRATEELKTYGNELTQLIQQAAQLLNVKDRGQYIFSGTASDQAAFVVNTDSNGAVTAVTYQGNTSVSGADIETNTNLSVDVPGENNSGSGVRGLVADSRFGADLFNHLITLQNHLLSGDTASIAATDRSALAKDEENMLYHIGLNGTTQTRLETASAFAEKRSLSIQQMISKEADADMAQTLVSLKQTQTAYEAALQSSAGLLKMSLLDYV